MMKPKKAKMQKRQNIQLSAQDVSAVLCALPLISYYETGSEIQDQINDALMTTAMEKLATRSTNFVPNEYRIIYTAIALAVNMETYLPDIQIDPEWKADLQHHFFTLNRLHALTKDQIYK